MLRLQKHLDQDALRTTVTFVDRQALQRAGTQTDTQVELAQLYAHINSMPESAKKRKLLKQVSRIRARMRDVMGLDKSTLIYRWRCDARRALEVTSSFVYSVMHCFESF